MQILTWYHTHAFLYLHQQMGPRLSAALTEFPLQLRQKELLPHLTDNGMDRGASWELFWRYLTAIEHGMEVTLSQHSVGFWIHLYRRIGVMLSPTHDNKTDPITVALVRRIAELAIHRFGRIDRFDDMASSDEVRVSKILGGHFLRIAKKLSGKDSKKLKMHIDCVATTKQWVMVDFAVQDLIKIYKLEGLAYEYWRATAALRSIGKGARVKRAQDDWDYERDLDLVKLVASYDQRIEAQPFSHSMFGSWFHPAERRDNSSIGFTVYNAGRSDLAPAMRALGLDIPGKFCSNFVFAHADVKGYRRAHDFVSEAFKRKYDYSLDTLLAVLAAASSLIEMPNALVSQFNDSDPSDRRDTLALHLLNLLQRGYSLYEEVGNTWAEAVKDRANVLAEHLGPFEEEKISACVADLTLSEDKRRQIGIWAGGRRFPFIAVAPRKYLIDCAGYHDVLQNLFFAIAAPGAPDAEEVAGRRGIEFEAEFRLSLQVNGFQEEHHGVIESADGRKREIDSSVRLGRKLYLFECRTAERPLDFEIGKPRTIDMRCGLLKEKVDQLDSLVEFIRASPSGKNYDFSWASDIVSFVVSPFIEWIWSIENRLWHVDAIPRIVSADEAIVILKRANCAN